MVGQRQKGKNNKKKSKVRYEMVEPSEEQKIAIVEDSLGGYPPRFSVNTIDEVKYIVPIQGSIAKGPRRVIVKRGDYVLLDKLEGVSGDKYYINHVYTKDDVRELTKKGYLEKKVKKADEVSGDRIFIGSKVDEKKDLYDELEIENL